jgi:(2R)-phospho-3-sulfolactate synthase (ComA)
VDSVKFAGGSFCLMPQERLRELIDVCHRHDVIVSTGGFLERALRSVGVSSSAASRSVAGSVSTKCHPDSWRLLATTGEGGSPIEQLEAAVENVRSPRYDVIAMIVAALGLNRAMFEAADPAVFTWYVKTYGPDVNLFVDHSKYRPARGTPCRAVGHGRCVGRIVTFKPS